MLDALERATRPMRQARHRVIQRRRYVDWLVSAAGPRCGMPKQIDLGLLPWTMIWLRQLRKLELPKTRQPLWVPTPPSAKHAAIRRYGREHGLRTFVETGTYLGDTTAAVAGHFAACFTIELSPALHAKAASRFADQPHVRCLLGDSASALRDLLDQIRTPTLFWLDAHHSGGATAGAGRDPILQELDAIYQNGTVRHVVLIDDAGGHDVDSIIRRLPGNVSAQVRNDIIRITPS